MVKLQLGVIAIVVACAVAARAQEAPAIMPVAFRVAVGAPLVLTLKSAVDESVIPWNDARTSWSFVRVSGTQENSDTAPREEVNGPPGSVRIASAGAAVIGVDFKPRVVTIQAADLRRFASDRAGSNLPEAERGGVVVRLVESAKTVARVGDAEPGRSANVTEKTGQFVEIRPLFDPTGIAIGSDIPVVTYADGGRAANARVIATHIASGERQEVRTRDNAIGNFRLSRAGVWRVEFHQLAAAPKQDSKGPLADRPQATWVLSSATLTFETMAEPAKGAAPVVKEGVK